jgi:hypothetical protein
MTRLLFAASAALLVTGLFPGLASAGQSDVIRGETTEVTREFNFTFWQDFDHYYVLKDGLEQGLILNPVITAPQGVEVTTLDVKIRTEEHTTSPHPAVRGPQTVYTYKRYVVTGKWSVKVAKDCPLGERTVTVHFPGISRAIASLGVGKSQIRTIPTGCNLDLKVFADRAALEAERAAKEKSRWPEYVLLVVIWSFVGLCGLVMLGLVVTLLFGKRPALSAGTTAAPERREEPRGTLLSPAHVEAILAAIRNRIRSGD